MHPMRPYTSLLAGFSVAALLVFTACSSTKHGGSFVVSNASTDIASNNRSFLQTNPYVPSADGPRSVQNSSLAGSNVSPHLMLAAAALGLTGGSTVMGPGEATFNFNQLLKFSPDPQTTTLSFNTGIITGSSDGLVAWGRWAYNPIQGNATYNFFKTTTGNSTTLSPLEQNGGFHYVVGAPTPVASLPTSGTVNYNLLGASQPTRRSSSGADNNATTFQSGSLAVLWGGASTKIGVDFVVSTPGGTGLLQTYHASTTGGLANPGASQLGLTSGTSTFAGSIFATTTDANACFGNGGQCVTNVSGFFAGPAAERAGLSYVINPGGNGIYGAAAFTTGAVVNAPAGATSAVLAQMNPVNITFAGGPANPPFIVASNGSVTQNADFSLSAFTASPGVADFTRGTTSSGEVGSDGIITWGRWILGTPGGILFGSAPNALTNTQALHYIAGVPTSPAALPISGTATFNLLGATSPTFGNGIGGVGSVTAGTLAVAWGGSATTKIGMDMSINMPGDAIYRIQTTGGLATPGTSQIAINPGSSLFSGNISMPNPTAGRACLAGGCIANISGFFAGAAAERAGVAYGLSDGTLSGGIPINGIFGAAAFKR